MSDLLTITGVSRPTLSARFKASLGHTPIEEIRAQRVEYARRLLLTELPIAKIVRASGFHTATHFSKAFRELTGQTPSELRREMRASKKDSFFCQDLSTVHPIGQIVDSAIFSAWLVASA